MNNKRVGILDSGLGGLSVLRELLKILPNEDYLFYEDSINNPYGDKSNSEIFDIVSNIVNYLLEKECKIIVLACNTATTSCLKKLRKIYPNTIFVGTVPALKVSFDHNFKNTLLLATPYTIKSTRVEELINDFKHSDQNVYLESGKNLAHLIELGDAKKIEELLEDVLTPYKNKIDSIVLGCTHYPLIRKTFKNILPNTEIIDGSIGVACEVQHQLTINNLLSDNIGNGNVIIENSKSKELIDRSYEILSNIC